MSRYQNLEQIATLHSQWSIHCRSGIYGIR